MNQDQFDQLCWAIGIAAVFVVVAIKGVPAGFGTNVGIVAAVLFAGYIAIKAVHGFVAYAVKQVTVDIPSKIKSGEFRVTFAISCAIFSALIVWFNVAETEPPFLAVGIVLVGVFLAALILSPEEASK